MAEDVKFCVCCGEDVPYSRIKRDEKEELTCVYCGFVLDIAEGQSQAASCIVTVDDSSSVRDLLKGMLVNKGIAQTVIASENGQEFIGVFNKRLADHQPVDMVILDLEMPVMDGISAARMMRSMEDKYQTKRTPILFFSARKCDDSLKKQLGIFTPAVYVNKGPSTHPDDLVNRIDQLVTYLLNERAKQTSP